MIIVPKGADIKMSEVPVKKHEELTSMRLSGVKQLANTDNSFKEMYLQNETILGDIDV